MRVADERDAAMRRYTSAAGRAAAELEKGLSPELTIVSGVSGVKHRGWNVS
jgi:hypothetical protein